MACVAAVLAVLLLAAVPAYATDYTVGDSQGWTQGVDYSTWASDKTFAVGDTLLFQYGFLHTVDEVAKTDYDACSSSNTLQSYSDQNTKITLSAPGPRYFICGSAGHCTGGMKLAVNVGSGSSPTTPTTPSTPGGASPTTPSTPADASPTTPSGTPSAPSKTPSKTTPSTQANAVAGLHGGSVMLIGALLGGVALLV